MATINNNLGDYFKQIGGQVSTREEKINKLLDQITGDGNKKIKGGNKKIIAVQTVDLSENNKVEIENPVEFKNYLLNLKKQHNINTMHEFFSSEQF